MSPFRQWWTWLFDFSQGTSENQRYARALTGLLQVALAESETDAGFEQCFRQCVRATNGLAEEHAWFWLSRHLQDYRRAGEFHPQPRTLAARFLQDIPRRYGVKPPEPPAL